MAITTYWYGNAMAQAFNKEIDWVSDTIKIALLTSSYTPDQDAHDYWNDVSTNEVTGVGYTASGATLEGKSAIYTGATNVFAIDASDVSWAGATIAAQYAVIYDSTGVASTAALICYTDFGTTYTSTVGTFTITWNAAGIAKITVS